MSTTVAPARPVRRLPEIARLGFDDGWLSLGPHFLNFGLPVLLIDHRLIGCADQLGLEPFGFRDPYRPLRTTTVRAEISGDGISLWSTTGPQPSLLAAHWFESNPTALLDSQRLGRLILIAGDSYTVQLSWSALWTCHIGTATVAIATESMIEPSASSGNQLMPS